MASTKFSRRDLNRFRKVYPYLRRSPRYAFTADKETILEADSVSFSNTTTGTHTFVETFPGAPVITAISYDTDGDTAVNIIVKSVSTTTVTFESSDAFTGTVQFHAMWIAP